MIRMFTSNTDTKRTIVSRMQVGLMSARKSGVKKADDKQNPEHQDQKFGFFFVRGGDLDGLPECGVWKGKWNADLAHLEVGEEERELVPSSIDKERKKELLEDQRES